MYAIIDIETTGGSPKTEKITEIAIFVHNGSTVVNEYSTLINPEKKIPYHITQLTGITNAMVANAPKFYEVAKKIVEITENCVFVAHNVNFDYSFIKEEFQNLGFTYFREKLCTVKLSRKIIPGYPSYSLGKLCQNLNIEINGRHRAASDALATVKLFEILLDNDTDNKIGSIVSSKTVTFNDKINPETVFNLPEKAGVYYFFDEDNKLIYIGKSIDIRARVLSHFRNTKTRKAFEMKENIADIDFILTGNGLLAELLESDEIKKHTPKYNRAQRRTGSHYGLYTYTDSAGYIRFHLNSTNNSNEIPLTTFSGKTSGKSYIERMITEFQLCQKLCGLYQTNGACFHYEIMECKGACVGKESPESYNSRAELMIIKHEYKHKSFFIIEEGRNADEIAIIKIENNAYRGFGYIDKDYLNDNYQNLHDCIQRYDDNRDIQQILRKYLRTGRPIDVFPF